MMVGGRVDDIVLTHLGAVHCEAVVMLGSDRDVLHAGVLGDGHPLVGIELYRVELRGELLVVMHRNAGAKHDPFPKPVNRRAVPLPGGHGVNAPVNKHSEAGIGPPLQTFLRGWTLSRQRQCSRKCKENDTQLTKHDYDAALIGPVPFSLLTLTVKLEIMS